MAQIYFIANTKDSPTANVSTGSTVSAAADLGSLIKSNQGQGGGSSEEEGEIQEDSGEKHQNNI